MTWEEFQIQVNEYLDMLDELQKKTEDLSDDAETIMVTNHDLEKEQIKILYGDASKEFIAEMEKTMSALEKLEKKRTARIEKLSGKSTDRVINVIDSIPKPIAPEISILFEIVMEITEMLREMGYLRRNLTEVLQLLDDGMETIQELKKHLQNENRLTPEQATVYTRMQNLLFESYTHFLEEKKQRREEKELLTDEVREHLQKMENLPPDLKQAMGKADPLKIRSLQVYNKACELIQMLNNSEQQVRKGEQELRQVIKARTCTEEELFDLSAQVESNTQFFTGVIAKITKMKKPIDTLISSVRKTTEALRYFAAEM